MAPRGLQPSSGPSEEYSLDCNQLLFDNHRWCMATAQRDHPMPHFFQDILSLNHDGVLSASHSYSRKRNWVQRSILVIDQMCNTRSITDCDLCPVPYADFGCSGLPCTDMSVAGFQMKRGGPANSVYLTHAKYVESFEVPLFVIDCAPEFRLTFPSGRSGSWD